MRAVHKCGKLLVSASANVAPVFELRVSACVAALQASSISIEMCDIQWKHLYSKGRILFLGCGLFGRGCKAGMSAADSGPGIISVALLHHPECHLRILMQGYESMVHHRAGLQVQSPRAPRQWAPQKQWATSQFSDSDVRRRGRPVCRRLAHVPECRNCSHGF